MVSILARHTHFDLKVCRSVTPMLAMASYEVQTKAPLILLSLPAAREGAAMHWSRR